jgi:trehalose-phosphatase
VVKELAPSRSVGGLAPFLARVAEAKRRALLLDYDGTLAPITSDRRHAEPYASVRAALMSLAAPPNPTAVWIVSGRGVCELARLARLDHYADLWGSHGLERRTRQGCWVGPAPARDVAAFLDEVNAFLCRSGAASLTERKLYGLAIHRRGVERAVYERARGEIERRFAPPAAARGLDLLPFDGGVELRPRGVHKGLVVERAFADLGNDAAVAYLGDDQTDEDAFAAIRGRGLPVLVRSEPRETLAGVWLRPPAEVLAFLEDWKAASASPSP